ncbi:hypothetical protein GF374_02170 [Candidatus Woesearchaeota archaeon]|nr:hypothetical protein [Candidatus Woesearchaeota archaeon]
MAIKKPVKKFETTIATALATAFGLTIALFWRDAIRAFIDEILISKLPQSNWIFSIIAALIVTMLCSLGIWMVSRWSKKEQV